MPNEKFALQLWTVRDHLEKDVPGTFKALKSGGYDCVESANFAGMTVQEFNRCAQDHGLEIISAHVPYIELKEKLDQALADIQTLGCKFAVLPVIEEEQRKAPHCWEEVAATLNSAGTAFKEMGVQLCYHNHDFEFISNEEVVPYGYLLNNTEPEFVNFELDLGWAHYAGVDVAALLQNHEHRFPLLHFKDIKAHDGGEAVFVPLGEGATPFQSLRSLIEDMNVVWYITEQDECAQDSIESAIVNLHRCRAMVG